MTDAPSDGPDRQPRPGRWRGAGRWVALGVGVILVVTTGAVAVIHQRLPADDLPTIDPGNLRVAEEARGSYRIGPATVEVGDERVEVRRAGRVVWSSPVGTAFLAAARGRLEVEEHRGYFWPAAEQVAVRADQSVDAVERGGGRIVLRGSLRETAQDEDGQRYAVSLRPDGNHVQLRARLTMGDETDVTHSVALFSQRSSHAGVHGFGEQFTDFDLDGQVLPLLVREQGVGRGTQPLTFLADVTNRGAGGTERMTYAAWASFVTDDLRGLRLDPETAASHAVGLADLSDPDRIGLQMWADELSAELTAADTPAALVTAQQAETPRTPMPEWSQDGLIAGVQGGSTEVRRKVAALQNAGVDLAGVWIQDWVGQRRTDFGDRLWWTWQRDDDRYPDWPELVDELRSDDLRVTTYVNPFLARPDADRRGDRRNLEYEARKAGHLITSDGALSVLDQGGFDASLVDLTKPRARRWFTEVIAEEVLTPGVDGFMADFGEGLPFDSTPHRGSAELLHNRWPALWRRTVRDACRLAEQPDCLVWFRSGSLGSSPGLAWNGDQMVDFSREDGLASVLLGTFSAGVSGWPVVHSDLGGYTSVDPVVLSTTRTRELMQRWAELAAFGPVMRSHEGILPDANLQLWEDRDVRDHLARMTAIYRGLAPYRREVLAEAVRTGLPAWRHGWLVAPGSEAADVDTQVFFGDDVLIAPVLAEGAREVEVVLPPGPWRHLFTGEDLEGDQTVTVEAPIGRPAAFVRADSRWIRDLAFDPSRDGPTG